MANVIRPVTEADYDAILRLQAEVWFPQRDRAGWSWLIDDNPDQGELPGGLVYACDETGDVGAFIGLSRIGFSQAGQDLYAGFGHTLIARPGTGGAGLRLAAAAARRIKGFAEYTLNNNERSVRVYQALHARPLHAETASLTANWVANPMLYLRAGLFRRIHAAAGYRFASRFGERMAALEHSGPDDADTPAHVARIADPRAPSSELDAFAARLAAEDFITARRDHARRVWRLSDPQRTLTPLMWVYDRGDGVEGWLIAMITKESEIAAPALSVIDLISLSDSAEAALPPLLDAALTSARAIGVARLSLPHFCPQTAKALESRLEDAVVRNAHPHAHVIGLDMTHDEIEARWRHTPWDGDYFFSLRQPPMRFKDR